MDREVFHAYVDEVGDRGIGPKCSPFFAFCGVVIRDRNLHLVDPALDKVCAAGRRAPGSVVKWRKLNHLQKRLATELVGRLPVRLIYVVVPKDTLPAASGMAADHGKFYNYAARLLLERVAFLVDSHGGIAHPTFEKVKGFPTYVLTDYVAKLRTAQPRPSMLIRWAALSKDIRVRGPAEVRALCLADIGAGALEAAIKPEENTGLREHAYLSNLAKVVHRSNTGEVLRYGIKVLGGDAPLVGLDWWEQVFGR